MHVKVVCLTRVVCAKRRLLHGEEANAEIVVAIVGAPTERPQGPHKAPTEPTQSPHRAHTEPTQSPL